MQSSFAQHAVHKTFLSIDCKLYILRLDEPPVGYLMTHPLIILRARLRYTCSTVRLAIVAGVERAFGIESSDEEQILAERYQPQWIQPCDIRFTQIISSRW